MGARFSWAASRRGVPSSATLAAGLALLGNWRDVASRIPHRIVEHRAIVLKVLTDSGEIDAPHGRLATGVLIFQDLCVRADHAGAAVPAGKIRRRPPRSVLAARQGSARRGGRRHRGPHDRAAGTRRDPQDTQPRIVLDRGDSHRHLTALGTAAAGASLALGAFLAGLIISESDYGHQALAELMPFRDIFISLFLVAVGMLVGWISSASNRADPGRRSGDHGGKTLSAAVDQRCWAIPVESRCSPAWPCRRSANSRSCLAKEGASPGCCPTSCTSSSSAWR